MIRRGLIWGFSLLNKKIKLYILVSAVVGTLIFVNFYVFPAFDTIQNNKLQMQSIKIKESNIAKEKLNLESYNADFEEIKKNYAKLTSLAVSGDNIEDANLNLQKIVLKHFESLNINSSGYTTMRPTKKGDYYILSIKVNFNCNINEFIQLIEDIENSEQLVSIDYISVNQNRRTPEVLQIEMNLNGIYFEGVS